MREVAKEAKCTPALIHYYFGDKDTLIEELFTRAYEDMETELRQTLSEIEGNPAEALRMIVREFILALGRNPYTAHLTMHQIMAADPAAMKRITAKFVSPFAMRLDQVMEAGVRRGLFREQASPTLGVTIVGSALYYFIGAEFGKKLYGIDVTDPEVVGMFADRFAELILNGLREA
jgi:TetR/AcrR family transcriptional regulator